MAGLTGASEATWIIKKINNHNSDSLLFARAGAKTNNCDINKADVISYNKRVP